MKPKSCKAKGRRLQNQIVADIIRIFHLSENDVRPAIMGERGADIKLAKAALARFPFAIEAKNTERLALYESLAQAERNAGSLAPLLVFKRNRSEIYCCLKWADFLRLFE